MTSTSSAPLLEGKQLKSIRGDRLLFASLDIRVQAGHGVLLTGSNGSGKTSLLRILAGLAVPEKGQVNWRGRSVRSDRSAYWAELTYLGHTSPLKLELSPLENLRFLDALHNARGLPAETALKRMELSRQQHLPCRVLSAGQRRRVALARLLTTSAPLWLLDEPYTALDKEGCELLETLLHEHLRKGGAAILSSHQRPLRRLPLSTINLDDV